MTSLRNPNKICAVIPFYNEEDNLHYIISNVINIVDALILVNDGSTDESLKHIPKKDKIILIEHDHNMGKGAALRTGLTKSIEIKSEKTITLDADGQHDPSYINNFIEALEKSDCVIGSRQKSKSNMPIHRKLSNFLTSKLLALKTGCAIFDSQCGYRAFRTELLNDILPSYNGFEAESEMIVKLCRKDYTLKFIAIPTIYGNDDSKMKAVPTIIGFLKVLLWS